MKKLLFLKLLALVACLSSAFSANATTADFSATYSGKTIYYKITSSANKTVEVADDRDGSISSYSPYSGSVTIPSTVTYNGTTYTVTGIGAGAFSESRGLTSVSMPNTITYIGQSAFAYNATSTCSPNFNTVTIPNSVTTIGDYAFYNTKISTVYLGFRVQSIGDYAFMCDPENGIYPSDVYSYCYSPPAVQEHTFFRQITGGTYGRVIKAALHTLVGVYGDNVYQNSSIWQEFMYFKTVSGSTAYDAQVGGLYYYFEVNVYTNGNLRLKAWVTNNGNYNCYTGSSYSVPATVTWRGESFNVLDIQPDAFRGCTSVNTLDLSNATNLTSIGDYACYGCTNLGTVYLSPSITDIGAYAFYNCTYLRHLYTNNSTPPSIVSTTFNTYSTTSLHVPKPADVATYQAAPYWSNFKASNYYTDQAYDFYTGGIYYNITGSNTVKVVNKRGSQGAFNAGDFSYSGNVTIPNTVTYNGTTYNVTAIGVSAFTESYIVNKNSSGETPRDQGDLKTVSLSNSVTTIEENAFRDCTGLSCVNLGTGVTSIASETFKNCTSLTSVISRRTTPPTIQSTTFDTNHYSTATLYVPSTTAVNNYKAATYWKNFTNIKVIPTLNEVLNVSGGTINFTSTGSYPWMVMADGGGLYAQSGNYGIHSSSSTLTATVTVPTGGASLTFDFKAWGEGTSSLYDKCIFSVDGTQKFSYAARDNDWESYSVQLTAGTHTLTWTYQKDGSINPIGDFFAVRNVKLNVEAYACYTSSNTTLTFYYDGLRSSRTGTTYDLNEGNNYPDWYTDSTNANVTKVVFDPSFANARPTSTYSWFDGMSALNVISGLSNLNTENVTTMIQMFQGCTGLTSLDLSNFNTANVTRMGSMFAICSNLTSLDLSSFNTANVTNMAGMFSTCSNLTSLDLSSFNTSKVTIMISMFYRCTSLTSLDLSHFNTANVTNTSNMFYQCSNLTTIYAGNGWSTNAVTGSSQMFTYCSNLVGGMGTTYSTSNPKDKTYARIDGGPSNPGYFTDKNASQSGDVNGDGSVTIADVTALIDLLLGGGTPPATADVNGDNAVTIADVTALIDMLLSNN